MGLLRDSSEGQMLGRYSTFHSVENVIGEVTELLMKSERLKRLMYYTDKQALSMPAIKPRQMMEILSSQIQTYPRLYPDEYARPLIMIHVDKFVPSSEGSQYRDFELRIDCVMRWEEWPLTDFKLRPYAMAGEIDAMVNKSKINTNGIADFKKAELLNINDEFGGISLYYNVHAVGYDTKIHPEEETEE